MLSKMCLRKTAYASLSTPTYAKCLHDAYDPRTASATAQQFPFCINRKPNRLHKNVAQVIFGDLCWQVPGDLFSAKDPMGSVRAEVGQFLSSNQPASPGIGSGGNEVGLHLTSLLFLPVIFKVEDLGVLARAKPSPSAKQSSVY